MPLLPPDAPEPSSEHFRSKAEARLSGERLRKAGSSRGSDRAKEGSARKKARQQKELCSISVLGLIE